MALLPKDTELARIEASNGFTYQITPEDAEILLRMAVYEGGDPAYTLWAIAQRFVAYPHTWTTLKRLVQDFSQPLNPKWRRDGLFCRPGGKYAGTDSCAEASLKRRDTAALSSLEDVYAHDPRAFDMASAWLRGAIPNPIPRAINWSAQPVAQNYLRKHKDAREVARSPANTCPACNIFIIEPPASKWPTNFVWLRAPGGKRTTDIAPKSFAQGLWQGLTAWWSPTGR